MPPKHSSQSQQQQLQEAPTFHPTIEDFRDPLAYIAKIRHEAEGYGACKIVPPNGWDPPFALDRRGLRFKTRVQSVHELQERSSAEDDFEEAYFEWMKLVKRVWKGSPMLNGREVDLFKLQKVVNRRGGFQRVTDSKSWKEVCRILQIRDKAGNAAYMVRQLYQKHLVPYEEYRAQQPHAPTRNVPKEPQKMTAFEKMVASANGKEDIDVLGAVAALMDAPGQDVHGDKRLKAHVAQALGPMRVPENIQFMVCELCKGGHKEDKIILCDKCDRGCHMFCLQPALDRVPEGEWVCPLCIGEEVESRAFRAGKEYSLDGFERVAREFKVDWFGSAAAAEKATIEDIEREFWDVVEAGEEPVEVMYGADLDTSVLGSAFPVKGPGDSLPQDERERKYAQSPWNLNNLPKLEGSLLKHLEDNIAGVTLPWLYLGMMFSSFCWHIEDHMFYSINYHHWGEAKRWYSVPSSAAEAFETAFRTALPELFEKQPDVLFHLVTMLSPRILQAAQVPVYSISQMPGEFVVTFPCAYHGGFNTGLNCAEAVNFAPSDWLRFGQQSVQRFQSFRKQPVLSHSWLLLQVAADKPCGELAYWAEKELRRVVKEEREWRYRLQRTGCYKARRVEVPVGMEAGAKDDAECAVCHCYLHLSAVECKCCPRRYVCLRHANNLCDCPPTSWQLAYRHSLGELSSIVATLSARVPPEMRYEPQDEAPSVNGNLAHVEPLKVVSDDAPAPAELQQELQPSQSLPPESIKGEPMDIDDLAAAADPPLTPPATSRQPSAELMDDPLSEGPGVPCREPSGNLADAEEDADAQPPPGSTPAAVGGLGVEPKTGEAGVSPVSVEPKSEARAEPEEEMAPLIPRKRGRKAVKESRNVKPKSMEPDPLPPPVPRLTRAAIKAEEEAQDTMDVLKALTDLADMPALEEPAGSKSPSGRGTPAPVVEGAALDGGQERTPAPVAATAPRPAPLPAGILNRNCQYGTSALTDDFDVDKVTEELQDLHRGWLERGHDVFRRGGARAAEVEALVQQSAQLMWGDDDIQVGVPQMVARLKDAQAWAQKIASLLKNKAPLEEVENALKSAPIAVPGLHRLVEGVRGGHAWLEKLAALDPQGETVELRAIESLVAEGQRLPLILPGFKELKERMLACRQLLEDVRQALPGHVAPPPVAPVLPPPEKMRSRRKRHSTQDPDTKEAAVANPTPPPEPPKVLEVTVEYLHTLEERAAGLRVTFPELDEIRQAIAGVGAFQVKMQEVLQGKPTLDALKELAAEYDSLAVVMPEMQTVTRLMASVKAWMGRARGVSQPRTALKKMREVLAAGMRLAAEVPQVEQLRNDIRRREWEENGKKMVHNKHSVATLAEALEDAAALGEGESPLAMGIRKRLEDAKEWDARAASFFSTPGRCDLAALEELVGEGEELGVLMESLSRAGAALEAGQVWEQEAAAAQINDVQQHDIYPHKERQSLAWVERHLAEYEDLIIASPHAERLQRTVDRAHQWLPTARAVLKHPVSHRLAAQYKSAFAEGWKTGVHTEEMDLLQTCIDALGWMRWMRKFGITALPATPPPAPLPPTASPPDSTQPAGELPTGATPTAHTGNGTVQSESGPAQAEAAVRTAGVETLPPQTSGSDVAADAAVPMEVDSPSDRQAGEQPAADGRERSGEAVAGPEGKQAGSAEPSAGGSPGSSEGASPESLGQDTGLATKLRWATEADEDAAAEAEASGEETVVPSIYDMSWNVEDNSVEKAKVMLEDAQRLPVDAAVVKGLAHTLDLVQDWETRLAAVAQRQEQNGIPPWELMPLVEEARGMTLRPESLPALEDALVKARGWELRAERLFNGDKPYYAEVVAICTSGSELLVQVEAGAKVAEVVAAGQQWQEKCCALMSKRAAGARERSPGHRLGKCIRVVTSSLDRALEQLELRIMEESERPGDGGSDSEQEGEKEEDERDLYCVCQQPYDADTAMVSCDNCEEWFHCSCISISPATARSIKKYTCPLCLAIRGNTKDLEWALLRTRRTRRALPVALETALEEAASLPCIMEDADALAHALLLYHRWLAATTALLEGHNMGEIRIDSPEFVDLRRPKSSARAREATPDNHSPSPGSLESETAEPEDRGRKAAVKTESEEHGVGEAGEDVRKGSGDEVVRNGGRRDETPAVRRRQKAPRIVRSLRLKTLSQLLKSALSIELHVGPLEEELLTALRLQRWRIRVEAALRPNSKYTVDALCKLAKEGEAAGVNLGSTRWARLLFERASSFRKWQDRVDDVIASLAEAGTNKKIIDEATGQARLLLKEGRAFETASLPRGFEKELARLEEASKLYCVCQLPYNEDKPMLGCEYCQDWFHYDCVGLRAPSDDEDDADVAPEDYRCPNCCAKAGERYPHQRHMPARSLEILGWAQPEPKPLEAIARSMAQGLAHHANGNSQPAEVAHAARQATHQPVAQSSNPAASEAAPKAADGREARSGDMFSLPPGELYPGASRLHELLSRSQREALGEAQQAMLSAGEAQQALMNGGPSQLHPQSSWLFNALAVQQQQQQRPRSEPRRELSEQQTLQPSLPAASEQQGSHSQPPPTGGYCMPSNAHMYQNPASFLIQRMNHVQGHPIQGQTPSWNGERPKPNT